jgi:hypothetical protein
MLLFESDMTKSFLNKLNLKSYMDSLFWKNRILWFGKPDGPISVTSTSCLIFFYLDPLMPFSLFFCFKIP